MQRLKQGSVRFTSFHSTEGYHEEGSTNLCSNVMKRERRNTHKYLRELLCLPFLPHQHIQPIFKDFQDLITPEHPEALHDFLGYLENTWIQGNVWTPAD